MTFSIVPRPESIAPSGEVFLFDSGTPIVCGPGCEGVGGLLRDRLRPSTGFEFDCRPQGRAEHGAITIEIADGLPPSGYEISVTASGASLRGGDAAGAFHATQTFLQLCPPAVFRRVPARGVSWEVPGVEIRDSPRFGWRGMLIDVSRHFFGRDAVFKLIDALALHRMNVLHLHLTDDQGWRVQINRYPRLTEIGSRRAYSVVDNHETRPDGQDAARDSSPHDGYFTQEDLREIVAYAAERFITVMPEIDLPGHSQAAIAAYPELGNVTEPLAVWTDWGISTHVLNVEDATMEFYKNVLDEVLDVFPSEFIHIGGDEVPKDEWRASAKAQQRMKELGLRDEDELQSWVVTTFADHLAARGRRPVGWDEILEGGLPPGATVMSWRGTEGGVAAAEAGHDVVMTPYNDTYLYLRQSDVRESEPLGVAPVLSLEGIFRYDPMPPELSEAARDRVLGAQCQMWTEFVSSERQMHQMVFPRLSAFAEAVWRSGEAVDFADFETRLRVHRQRLHALDIDGYDPPAVDSIAEVSNA